MDDSERPEPDADIPTPADMKDWLRAEVRTCQEALSRRIKEATGFVDAYERGEISWEQCMDRHLEYADRWGDSFPDDKDLGAIAQGTTGAPKQRGARTRHYKPPGGVSPSR